MINIYHQDGAANRLQVLEQPPAFADNVVWLDLLNPDRSEETLVEKLLGIELPIRDELKDIEPSSRLHIEEEAVYMTASLICTAQSDLPQLADIASVVFLPPTLVASIYGMNFHLMPELDWNYGYAAALLGMLVSAIVPFVFFRWKGWL